MFTQQTINNGTNTPTDYIDPDEMQKPFRDKSGYYRRDKQQEQAQEEMIGVLEAMIEESKLELKKPHVPKFMTLEVYISCVESDIEEFEKRLKELQ